MPRVCKECSADVAVPAGFIGRHPAYCSHRCRLVGRKRARATRAQSGPVCSVEGCARMVTAHFGPSLCSTCYSRKYRGGTSELPKRKGRRQTSNGYLVLFRPQHPLARLRDGLVAEHRVVLYNAIGVGPHYCVWCGAAVTWKAGHVDHLDGDKRNNDVANLALSCAVCNQGRGIALAFLSRLTPEGFARFIKSCNTAKANTLEQQAVHA